MSKHKVSGALLPPLNQAFTHFPFMSHLRCACTIVITALVFYAGSFSNEYALDDGIIIHQNDHVLKGMRGVGDILTKDAYESFYRRMCATDQLAGGRYRPLSVVTFALEQEILGTYRSGLYTSAEDKNRNGLLDKGKVSYTSSCGRPENNYEINNYADANNDGQIQPGECFMCWDRNHNFKAEISEDLNQDGIFNEIDCQLYGAFFRHFNNIWLYALGCLLLYRLFSEYFFRARQDLAFLAALLFTIHPIHSEAVANVKSRDEILSLIFISLTFWHAFRFVHLQRTRNLLLAAFSFMLALLSKEYAVMLLVLVPLALYCFTNNTLGPNRSLQNQPGFKSLLITSLFFVACVFLMTYLKYDADRHALPGARPVRSFWLFPVIFMGSMVVMSGKHGFTKLMSWLYLVMLIYVGMRWMAVKLKPGLPDTELLNNPYLLATGEERFCTKTYVLLKYLMLQLFPHPLSSDYSFNSIPYRQFSSPDFIFSIVLHVSAAVAAVILSLKKHPAGFALMLYMLFALLIANIFMDIGATMGERLIFHSSIGFCIIVAWGLLFLGDRISSYSPLAARITLLCLVVAALVPAALKTWERNADWKNDITLFLKDLQTHPNSVLCLGNAGARYVDLLNTRDFRDTPVAGYDTGFNDHNGTLRNIISDVASGKYKSRREAAIAQGITVLNRAITLHPRYVNGYLNLGLLYLFLHRDFEALYNFKNVERIYPNNPYLQSYYRVYENELQNRAALAFQHKRWDSVAIALNLKAIINPRDAANWYQLGGAYLNQGKNRLARKSWLTALSVDPGHAESRRMLQMLRGDQKNEKP